MNIRRLLKKLNEEKINTVKDLIESNQTSEAIYLVSRVNSQVVAWSFEDYKKHLTFNDLCDLQLNDKMLRKIDAIQGNGDIVPLSIDEKKAIDILIGCTDKKDLDKDLFELIFGEVVIKELKNNNIPYVKGL